MDLRSKNISKEQFDKLYTFIKQRRLGYQPFIFSDQLETGEGDNFVGYRLKQESPGKNFFWEGCLEDIKYLMAENRENFQKNNNLMRLTYESFLTDITSTLGDISDLSFAEVGCNTGYFLHGLSLRGAKRCMGFDFTLNHDIFDFFNQLLGSRSEFYFAEWDSLNHKLQYNSLPEVDFTLSSSVLGHVADPLYHLAYLCDRSRKGIFVWAPVIRDESGFVIDYGKPSTFRNSLDWPLSFDYWVQLSIPIMEEALKQAGFREIYPVELPKDLPPEWKKFHERNAGFIALRTENIKTALSDGTNRRHPPNEMPLVVEGPHDHNIVAYLNRFYAIPFSLGPINLIMQEDRNRTEIFSSTSLDEVKRFIENNKD